MRSYKRFAVLIGAALAVAVLPAFAGASGAPTSGTWTFTDITPNPTEFGFCMGTDVPSAPGDVNTAEIKVTKKSATLTTTSHSKLDWAAEVRDSKGNTIESFDSQLPTEPEHINIALPKGKYTVTYCNWLGDPEITVDWSLK